MGAATRPLAVGGGIGAGSGSQVIVDNTVFWGNTGTEHVVFQAANGNLYAPHFLDIEQQFSTQPGPIDPLVDSGETCLVSGGSITYNNCAIEIVSLTFTDTRGALTSDGRADFAGMNEGSGNITPTSPGFESATGGDLRLSSTSVLIDAGNKLVDADAILAGFQLLPDVDLDGNYRVTDGDGDGTEEIDIGVYENQGG